MSRKTKHRTRSRLTDGRHRPVMLQLPEPPDDHSSVDQPAPHHRPARHRVLGIGGLFFRAHDPDALSCWYADHLGVGAPPIAFEEANWAQEQGPTVFAPFGPEHWGSPTLGTTGWGISFRVQDLDGMVSQLRWDGIDVDVDDELAPNGRFAQLHDPEGNPIQLWQRT